ncbi:rod shape-determining protein MreC [Floricoccus penangensis]|uniref:rod shape-determining protein MreC n=1 Tax=Floricoccus penangensis TaxID=1859475 RepID=UPI00203E087D|nr:rod shape-determining protein MreC [Floricoccus penangensis]URZ87882.1 rod shape-determining protein MreC [Floricoccus penangensis]
MKKLNVSKLIIISLLIIILAMGSIIISAKGFKNGESPSKMTQVVNDTTGGADKLLSSPGKFLRDKYTQIQTLLNTYDENKSLKKEIYELSERATNNEGLQAENKSLREALDLENTLVGYKKITANVISRNPSSWEDIVIIDAGSDEGIKSNMIVMAGKGIIGRVSQVNKKSSKISLLVGQHGLEDKIPVRIGTTDNPSYGLLSSYDSDKDAFVITQITSKNEIKKDDLVVTSGLGGDSPQDLPVGKVIDKKNGSGNMTQEIYVAASGNFYDLRTVTVVDRIDGEHKEEETANE